MATSVQESQPPHAMGTAANTARNGMITKAYRPIRTLRRWGPSVRGFGPVVGGASSTEVMAPRWTAGAVARSTTYAYVTVTYATVTCLWLGTIHRGNSGGRGFRQPPRGRATPER